ncbi:anthranilate synthase component I [Ammonifex thiophilus]|uniref:Anthranilate synthase component 1 n=1 Tax=Ammonifex thiophilus TaxID=444093 RepID=A0A3D8P2A2_9THEO|nr:anthranilate synthase component I [Ammonifex thiophilus]RDV80926.1 anthranilate synthase component I [Ammonifex thiophilus]
MFFPRPDEYRELSRRYRVVPVYRRMVADLETPIGAYKKLSPHPGYLLESVTGGEVLGRYSFLGFRPFLTFRAKGREVEIVQGGKTRVEGNPFAILGRLMEELRGPSLPDLPRFYGGAVGYFGYDLVRHLEKLPEKAVDDLLLPDLFLLFTRQVLIFDHVRRELTVVVNTLPANDPEKEYRRAAEEIEETLELLRRPLPCEYGVLESPALPSPASNFSRDVFCAAVRYLKERIAAGDALQVVLSQRFELLAPTDPFAAYRRLRAINPSPYLFYLDFGEPVVAGSSPEMLVRVEGGVVTTRPIAGTRPRGRSPEEDARLEKELLEDPKERAEHLMLVDLGRNDVGRIAEPGTVRVTEFMRVEKYSHVMHLVSEVQGLLPPSLSALEALTASFPAGTVTGAPKVKAMELIEELEPTRRGIYAGAVGYLSFTGNLDTCITIRTMVFCRGKVFVQAGAGIVADSEPEREFMETWAKARALLATLGKEGGR